MVQRSSIESESETKITKTQGVQNVFLVTPEVPLPEFSTGIVRYYGA